MEIKKFNLSTTDILNGMTDWVRVIDKDNKIIFSNRAMTKGLKKIVTGMTCYEAIGKKEPCENCISREAVFDGFPHIKEEIVGDQIFSVMSSPVRDEKGQIFAVVEVLRDITETRRLQKKILEQNQKLQKDLESAKLLHSKLLPGNFEHKGVNFSYVYEPCESLGGDFLDIYTIDEDHVGIYIADVAGHGLAAAMLTVFLYSTIDKQCLSPSQALRNLFEEFTVSGFKEEHYITVFYAVINLKNKQMTFSNAGHSVCPIVYNEGKLEILRSPGFPISSWTDDPGYKDRYLNLQKGDRLFLYTDGLVEIQNTNKQQFGEDRLLNILLKENGTPSNTLNSILDKFFEFVGTDRTKYSDDVTMALLEIK